MNLKYVFSLFLLTFFAVNALDGFNARIVKVDGRGSFSNDVLLIGNCNDPTKSQIVYLTLDMNYPREDCSGQMEVFYSYYDFPSNSYTDEERLCLITSSENCRGAFNINLGGMGEKTTNVDEYVRLRAVCKDNSQEFKNVIPITINHFPINTELDALDRISEVNSILYDAKIVLDECSQCNPVQYNDIKSRLSSLDYQIKSCDFTSYVSIAFELKNDAETMKTNYERVVDSYDVVPDYVPDDDEIDDVKEIIEDIKKETDSKVNDSLNEGLETLESAQNGICMIGLLLPFLLFLGLFLNKK